MRILLCAAALLLSLISIHSFTRPFVARNGGRVTTRNSYLEMSAEGGKIVVSGIGKEEEDEFMLNLLNEQVGLCASVTFFCYILGGCPLFSSGRSSF